MDIKRAKLRIKRKSYVRFLMTIKKRASNRTKRNETEKKKT